MKRKISTRAYAEALYESARSVGNDRTSIHSLVGAFVRHVVQYGGRSRLQDIMKAFSRVVDEKGGKVLVQITAANDRIVDMPETIGGLKVHIETSVDTSLIGGVRLRIGDTLIDNSLQTRIGRLRELFT